MFWHKKVCPTCGLVVDIRHPAVKKVHTINMIPIFHDEPEFDEYYCGSHHPVYDKVILHSGGLYSLPRYFTTVELICGKDKL